MANVEVLAVWEPMLPSDWLPPTTLVMRRLSDRRIRQFWDPQHLVAKRMAADARSLQPTPKCCQRDGILWDLVAVYPRGDRWERALPPAKLFDGPVYDLEAEINSEIVTLTSHASIRPR